MKNFESTSYTKLEEDIEKCKNQISALENMPDITLQAKNDLRKHYASEIKVREDELAKRDKEQEIINNIPVAGVRIVTPNIG